LYDDFDDPVYGYFIKDVNYVLDNQFRLCFKLSIDNVANSTDESDYYKEAGDSYLYTKDFKGLKSKHDYKYHSGAKGFSRSGSYCEIIKFFPTASF
jgi:hypothetical protein